MKNRPNTLLFTSIAVLATAALGQARPESDTVWSWFGDCHKPVMALQIAIKGRTIYRSSFHACRTQRSEAYTDRARRTRVFRFSGGHTFQDTYRTAKTEKIEGNIWQSGADPDAILLGVSFVAHRQVLLNTIYIVKPGEATQSLLDRDLLIRTYPLKPIAH